MRTSQTRLLGSTTFRLVAWAAAPLSRLIMLGFVRRCLTRAIPDWAEIHSDNNVRKRAKVIHTPKLFDTHDQILCDHAKQSRDNGAAAHVGPVKK
jgi:hypothetical protein